MGSETKQNYHLEIFLWEERRMELLDLMDLHRLIDGEIRAGPAR